jgi:type VI secretion system secreted protein VgrG
VFSRIKVQVHWDRLGKKDDKSSCWIRVSQPWAGKGWGSVSIPRIGQEVIVDFLEGDPDEPIITGRVYNADLMPPYSLPGDKVVSGMKSNSSPGGGGYNEISCNDTKGKEGVTIHAQYDMSTTVEHDDTQRVVSGNRKIDVETGTHTETIKGDTTITVTSGAYRLDVAANTHTHHVKGKVMETYDDEQETKVASNILVQSVNAIITVDAKKEIVLHCGESMMKLIDNGTIIISGKNIRITGLETTHIGVGNQNMVCDTAKVVTSGANITSNATGTHEIVGAPVKIN